jgi:type VI secretion system ImpM family protein
VVVPLSAASVEGQDAKPPARRWRAVLFGKLPSHGDFVCRGMSDAERAAWDTWADEGIAAARQVLGDGFDGAHGVAPPWQFIGGPGPFGDSWRAGCVAPSTDRAQRRFVIVAAVVGLDWGEALAFGPALCASLVDAIYKIFTEQQDADQALETICACSVEPRTRLSEVFASLASPCADGVWWSDGGERHAPRLEIGAMPGAGLLVRALTPIGGAP